ncbi:hypothetical protein ACHAXA_009674 [Cyclostephanos tholiformis]|uniref:Flavin reductase like domain-containing protein n=1 Tax=Cyclostephanos tholiformis TaxID=382380 RepID=A0ABD3RGZ5_9STRA
MIRLSLIYLLCTTVYALRPTSIPPLLDVPVYSLSTLCGDHDREGSPSSARTNMNILTYACPVSIQPDRIWCISLYRGTLSHKNFTLERRGILQLLRAATTHREEEGVTKGVGELIRVLGGSSGRDVDKGRICAELGHSWERLPVGRGGGEDPNDDDDDDDKHNWPEVLPSCLYYLKLELVGDMINCGSHEVALCKVVAMISSEEVIPGSAELDILSTRELRERSIISELGRII